MASSAADRDAFRDALDTLGLRVRESRRVYSVDVDAGTTGASLRALLLNAGIDAADIQKRLNAGETVHIAPATIGLPLPLPFDRWAADVLDAKDLQRRVVQRDHPQSGGVAAVLRCSDDDVGHPCVPGEVA